MDKAEDNAPPRYEDKSSLSYEKASAYDIGTSAETSHAHHTGTNLTIDPTGMSIIELPLDSGPPRYTFNTTLLHVNVGTSVHIQRPDLDGSPITVYAIGEEYISPMHTVRKQLRDVTAAHSHGMGIWVGLRHIIWDFSTRIPLKPGEGADAMRGGTGSSGLMGFGTGPGTEKKSLLRFIDAKWLDYDDEVLAIQREGGAECKGMPVLSVVKDLDQQMMDFLVSAWLVTLWGQLGKRAHKSK